MTTKQQEKERFNQKKKKIKMVHLLFIKKEDLKKK